MAAPSFRRPWTVPSPTQARELLQLIGEGFLFVDRDFRIREISAEGVRMANRDRAEIVGGILWDQAPQLRDTEFGQMLVKAAEERTPVSLQHLYTWPDGRQAWLEVRAFPADDGLAIFYRDISDIKRSEEELMRTQSELMHASRLSAMGTMASTLAHELAQPLTSAANSIEATQKMLRRLGDPKSREARSALTLAGSSVARASDIVRRLRGFVAKGRVEADTQNLASIIAEASVLMVPEAQRQGVEIAFKLDPRGQWVRADAVQVQQVLINLIRNAIQAMQESEERHIAVTTAAVPGGMVEVTIEDRGPGFGPDAAATVFAPFHSTKQEGMGVGLSICRTIIEAHGGTIEAGHRPGGGALFRFTLPRATPPE
jgi:two-component system, LuxR family, sensor kinase FixL